MPERTESEPLHPQVRYEPTDASLTGVLAFAIGLAILGVVVYLAVSGLTALLGARPTPHQPPSGLERPRFPNDLSQIPPPRLEVSDTAGLQDLRRHEEALLREYGWVDRKQQTVRIPIDEAIRLLADPATAANHGIQVRSTPPKREQP